jgi:hypothetical protein
MDQQSIRIVRVRKRCISTIFTSRVRDVLHRSEPPSLGGSSGFIPLELQEKPVQATCKCQVVANFRLNVSRLFSPNWRARETLPYLRPSSVLVNCSYHPALFQNVPQDSSSAVPYSSDFSTRRCLRTHVTSACCLWVPKKICVESNANRLL